MNINLKIPKGNSFATRFMVLLGAVVLLFGSTGIYMFFAFTQGDEITTRKSEATSEQAIASIAQMQAKSVPSILAQGTQIRMGKRDYTVIQQGGVSKQLGSVNNPNNSNGVITKGKGHMPYHEGDIIYRNGKAYRVGKDGKLYPVNEFSATHPIDVGNSAGDLIEKHGTLYQVGANGKLHRYHHALKAGDIVWKNGKAYVVGRDGKLHALSEGQIITKDGVPYVYHHGKLVPLSDLGAHPGDVVKKDGQYYRIGKEGKLVFLNQPPSFTDNIWKNGKLYSLNKAGQLVPAKEGNIVTSNGRAYVLHQGKLIKVKPCSVITIKGVKNIVDQEGRFHPFHEGEHCVNDKGQTLVMRDHQVITLPGTKASAPLGKRTQDKSTPLWTVKVGEAENNAMKAPFAVLHGDAYQGQTKHTHANSANDALSAEQKMIRAELKHSGSTANAYAMQNGQGAKTAFLSANEQHSDLTLSSRMSKGAYRYGINAGSIIPATLKTGINSDLPGLITAQVSRNVYDSRTGQYLLIPQGTMIFGVYDSQVTYGQNRVLMVWKQLEFPNGRTFDLQGMPGADLAGYSGLHDQVNNHYFRIFGSALLFSLFGAASQLSQPNNNGNGPSNQQIIYSAVGQQMTQVASKQVEANMDIQPTINIRPGDNFTILVSRQMVFDGPYQFDGGA